MTENLISTHSSTLLSEAGLKRTQARIVILDVLSNAGRPLSHQEISDIAGIENIDKVTLYRSLTALREAGLLHRIKGLDGIWRFSTHDHNLGRCGGSHAHFLCFQCGRMTCLHNQPLPWVDGPDNAEILGKQFLIYGRCAECMAGKAGKHNRTVREKHNKSAGKKLRAIETR